MHHNVRGDSFWHSAPIGGLPADAADGDTFNLMANHAQLGIYGMARTASLIHGTGNTVTFSFPTGANTVTDRGTGTAFVVNEASNPSLQHMVTIIGFQNDPTARLAISDPYWWKGVAPTITPDGQGGSLVTNSAGAKFVDLVGGAKPNLAQLSNFRAYV